MKTKAFTLIEVVLSVTLVSLVMTAVAGLVILTLNASQRNVQTAQALAFAQEGLEVVRYMRDSNWLQNYTWDEGEWGADLDGTLYLKEDESCPPCWALSSEVEELETENGTVFERELEISEEEEGLEVLCRVSWNFRGVPRSVELSTFLTNWQ